MEESLKAVRRIYYALIATCCALIVLAESPSAGKKYELAASELKAFLDLPWRSLKVRDCGRELETQLQELGQSFEQLLGQPIHTTWDSLEVRQLNRTVPDPGEVTIKELTTWVDRKYGGSCDTWVASTDKDVKDQVDKHGVANQGSAQRTLSFHFYSDTLQAQLRSLLSERQRQSPAVLLDTFYFEVMPNYHGDYGLDELLQRTGVPRGLSGRETELWEGNVYMPALRTIGPEIDSMYPHRAYQRLKELEMERGQQVSVLGLEVPERLALVGGPLAILALMAYMLAHVAHIRRQLSTDSSVVVQFPWAPLFPGQISSLFTYAIFMVLPSLSTMLLLWRHRGLAALSVAASLVIVLLGGVLSRRIVALKSTIHT